MIESWLRMAGTSSTHMYALHTEELDQRADEILAAWDAEARGFPPHAEVARGDALAEAAARARTELGWPEDWSFPAHSQDLMTLPLPEDLSADGWHWQDGMPNLP